ncbi:MAG: hypothetical protein Q9182_004191 [Xanthomendoza sp. 2 TL-2023]
MRRPFVCTLMPLVNNLIKILDRSTYVEIGPPNDATRQLDEDDHEYRYSYNSEVLQRKQVQWLGKARALGRNPNSKRCYITGEAEEVDDCHCITIKRGDHPHVPPQDDSELLVMDMYSDVVPVHDACFYNVLPKVLAHQLGYTDVGDGSFMAETDLDKLYTCIERSWDGECTATSLDLYYYEGQEASTEQWWVSTRGSESLVADPITIPQLYDYYGRLPSLAPAAAGNETKVASKEQENYDARQDQSLGTTAATSESLSNSDAQELYAGETRRTLDPVKSGFFWKNRIRTDMPWLWDLNLDCNMSYTNVDWRQIYLDMHRRSTFGSSDAILGLVNRRRIWKVFNQLAVNYAAEVSPVSARSEYVDPDVQEFSASPFVPILSSLSNDSDPQTMRVFFLTNLSEADSKTYLLESYWNTEGYLKGLAISTQGSVKRLFGLEPRSEDTTKSMVIDRGDWIQGITVGVGTAITGLTVMLREQGPRTLMQGEGASYFELPYLDLVVRPGTTFVGLEGEIANDIISRIGVLEYTKTHRHLDYRLVPLAKRQLWYNNWPNSQPMNEAVEAYPYHEGSWIHSTAECKLPGMTPLILSDKEPLSSISAQSDLDDLEFHTRGSSSLQYDKSGADTQMKWFPIDGVNGERVVGIEVDIGEFPCALRVSDEPLHVEAS